MKVPIIRIGNSKGIRLNKMLLKKYQIEDEVELVLEPHTILIKPVNKPRQDWEDAFARMNKRGEDKLLIDSALDPEEWD